METPDPNHPRDKLAFYVAGDVDFDIRDAVAAFVVETGVSRAWTLGPPQYFDIHEVPDDHSHGTRCWDDVGGFIEVYSGRPPWTVPREIDLQQFEESVAFLTALEEFSCKRGLDFEVHYAGEVIGYVTEGRMEGVREMLLDEWKQSFEGHPGSREQ